jgi:uncharacterized MAPEG superfamily protein
MGAAMGPELCFVGWSVVVGFVYIALPIWFATRVNGMRWNAGPRDEPARPMPVMGQRLERAKANFFETYPFFLAAVLMAVASGRTNQWTSWGAQTYVWARLVYIPLYAFGISYVRSLAWTVSVIGIGLILYGAVHAWR